MRRRVRLKEQDFEDSKSKSKNLRRIVRLKEQLKCIMWTFYYDFNMYKLLM